MSFRTAPLRAIRNTPRTIPTLRTTTVTARRNISDVPPSQQAKGGNSGLWLGIAALGVGAGGYYWWSQKESPRKELLKSAADSAAHGHFKDAAHKTKLAAFPELTATLTTLLGADIADSVDSTLSALREIEHNTSKAVKNDPNAESLKARAKDLEKEIRAVMKDAMNLQKKAVSELGPSAKAHYEKVKDAVQADGQGIWDSLEAGLKTLKKESKGFYSEAVSSNVGEDVRIRLQGLVQKAEELKKQAEKQMKK